MKLVSVNLRGLFLNFFGKFDVAEVKIEINNFNEKELKSKSEN